MDSFSYFWKALKDGKRLRFLDDLREVWGERVGLPPGVWCFRFKAQAGETWMDQDPWWNGRPPIMLRLKQDGRMEAASDAPGLWGRRGQPAGHYRVSEEEGRSVLRENGHPSLQLCRHPVHWGMYFQSCWTVWTAFPMAPHGEDPFMEDDQLSLGADDPLQAAEIRRYNARVGGGF